MTDDSQGDSQPILQVVNYLRMEIFKKQHNSNCLLVKTVIVVCIFKAAYSSLPHRGKEQVFKSCTILRKYFYSTGHICVLCMIQMQNVHYCCGSG